MSISQFLSSVVQLVLKSPTPEELGRAMMEADLMVFRHPVNPPILGFYEGFKLSDGLLSCLYYSRYMMEDDGKFARREVLIVEVEDRIGELLAAFRDGMPTAWRMGLENQYRPSITEREVYALKYMLGAARNTVALSATRGTQSA